MVKLKSDGSALEHGTDMGGEFLDSGAGIALAVDGSDRGRIDPLTRVFRR